MKILFVLIILVTVSVLYFGIRQYDSYFKECMADGYKEYQCYSMMRGAGVR